MNAKSKSIELYLSLASPWTFLALDPLKAIAERQGAVIEYHPVNYATVFAATGGLPLPKRAPERQRYRLMELRRFKRRLGVSFNIEPRFFPVSDRDAALMVLLAREQGGDMHKLCRAFLSGLWQHERNLADEADLVAIADAAGFDGKALLAGREAMAPVFEAESQKAIEKGVFGAPTMIVGDELFWGQDRLDFVEETLASMG